MPDVHAKLSASGSAKWLSCPAALALEAVISEPDTGSEHAREGTAAHRVLEMCLRHNKEPSSFLGEKIKVVENTPAGESVFFYECNQEMVDSVEVVVEYVQRLQAKSSFYEVRVDYSRIVPEGFGTADIVLEVYEKTTPNKRTNVLYVIDFKYGQGIRVDAYENSQGMLYGIGSLKTLDMLLERPIEEVCIAIAQPRMDNISEYQISIDELTKWGEEEVKPKAYKAYNLVQCAADEGEDALKLEDFNPTKKGCQWCQGRRLKKCKAYAMKGYEAAVEGFTDLTTEEKTDLPAIDVGKKNLKNTVLLSNADLAAVYKAMSIFKSFIKDLDDEIIGRINAGEELPGLELRPTLKARSWTGSQEDIIKAIRSVGLQKKDYEVTKLVTPTQAEAILKKIKPKDFKKRYAKLEEAVITRLDGEEKIVETSTKVVEPFGQDLLN